MKLQELLTPWDIKNLPDCEIKSISNNSKNVSRDSVFLAYPGNNSDGRFFIMDAIAKGARAILYEPSNWDMKKFPTEKIPFIAFENLSCSVSKLAARFFDNPSRALTITGITGTNGKTTCAYLLTQAYKKIGIKSSYIGTLGEGSYESLRPLNNTTPDAIKLQELFHNYKINNIEHVCMEVSSHALCQMRVNDIAFDHGIFTNLSHEHLDYHKSMDEYAKAKAKLFTYPSLKTALINNDDQYASLIFSALQKQCQKITYGLQNNCDIYPLKWHTFLNGSILEIKSPWGKFDFKTKLLGQFNIYNILAVFGNLLINNIEPSVAIQTIEKLESVPGRMEIISENPCIIVDYSHTPDALKNAISTLNSFKQNKLLVVFGCGGERDKEKRPLMGKVANALADIMIVTSDNPRTENPEQIINDITQGLDDSHNIFKIINRKDAIKKAIDLANEKDIILIAGKGHESYQQIGLKLLDFSDQTIIKNYIADVN